MSTKATPPSAGIAPKNFWKASSPPADAPMPTIGKAARTVATLLPATAGRRVAERSLRPAGFADLARARLTLQPYWPWAPLVKTPTVDDAGGVEIRA